MTDAPEWIWATFEIDVSAQTTDVYAQDEPEGFVGTPTKYIRADLAPVVTVKPLEFVDDKRPYANIRISPEFTGHYTIDPCEHGLEEVSFGIHCHEFGAEVIWRGPKGDGVQAANDHNRKRILTSITARIEPDARREVLGELEDILAACLPYIEDAQHDDTLSDKGRKRTKRLAKDIRDLIEKEGG